MTVNGNKHSVVSLHERVMSLAGLMVSVLTGGTPNMAAAQVALDVSTTLLKLSCMRRLWYVTVNSWNHCVSEVAYR